MSTSWPEQDPQTAPGGVFEGAEVADSGDLAASVFTFIRAAGTGVNPIAMTGRAESFAASLDAHDSAALLLVRTPEGPRGFFCGSGDEGAMRKAAINLATGVGATAEPVSALPDPEMMGQVMYRAEFDPRGGVGSQTLNGADPNETARAMALSLDVGDWALVLARRPAPREADRHRVWLEHRFGQSVRTHHSATAEVMEISLITGSDNPESAKRLITQTRAAFQGFDVAVKAKRISNRRGLLPRVLTSVAGLAALVLGMVFSPGPVSTRAAGASDTAAHAAHAPLVALHLLLLGAGGLGLIFGLAWWVLGITGRKPTFAASIDAGLIDGFFPRPPRRRRRPRPPRKEKTNRDGKTTEAFDGDYPLHPSVFQTSPVVFAGLIAPGASAESGEMVAKSWPVPPRMVERIGPLVGYGSGTATLTATDPSRMPIHLDANELFGGVFVSGKPGSGKSAWLRAQFGWACAEQANPSGLRGFPGKAHTLVFFENKGDGVHSLKRWAEATGRALMVVDLADKNTRRVDLFAGPGSVKDRAEAMVNQMVYGFEDGAIGDRAFPALVALYSAAIAVAETKGLAAAAGLRSGASPHFYAHVLAGNVDDRTATRLATEIRAWSTRPDVGTEPLRIAAEQIAPLFDRTEAQRRQLLESSANKISQLVSAEEIWWTPARKAVTWDQVLTLNPQGEGRIIVINTGAPAHVTDGSAEAQMVHERLANTVSAMLMYSLRAAIWRTCGGWQAQGRSITIFADELSLLAGTSDEVVRWFKDQGRSFGVRVMFATQRPEQLPNLVRSAVLGYQTVLSFNETARATAGEVATALSATDGQITPDEVMHLPRGEALLRTYAGGAMQEPVTVKAPYFEADPIDALRRMGYQMLLPTHVEEQVFPQTPPSQAPSYAAPAQTPPRQMPPQVRHLHPGAGNPPAPAPMPPQQGQPPVATPPTPAPAPRPSADPFADDPFSATPPPSAGNPPPPVTRPFDAGDIFS